MTRHQQEDRWRPPLRAVREAQGRALREVARIARVDAGFLSRIENGQTMPSVRVLHRLAVALKLRELERLLRPYVRPLGKRGGSSSDV